MLASSQVLREQQEQAWRRGPVPLQGSEPEWQRRGPEPSQVLLAGSSQPGRVLALGWQRVLPQAQEPGRQAWWWLLLG